MDGRLSWPSGPATFAACLADRARAGATLLGGCCGSTRAHLAAARLLVSNLH